MKPCCLENELYIEILCVLETDNFVQLCALAAPLSVHSIGVTSASLGSVQILYMNKCMQ